MRLVSTNSISLVWGCPLQYCLMPVLSFISTTKMKLIQPIKIVKHRVRPANERVLLCPVTVVQLVIFAFLQICHSPNLLFHNSPSSQQYLAALHSSWAKVFVFMRLCSMKRAASPCVWEDKERKEEKEGDWMSDGIFSVTANLLGK